MDDGISLCIGYYCQALIISHAAKSIQTVSTLLGSPLFPLACYYTTIYYYCYTVTVAVAVLFMLLLLLLFDGDMVPPERH